MNIYKPQKEEIEEMISYYSDSMIKCELETMKKIQKDSLDLLSVSSRVHFKNIVVDYIKILYNELDKRGLNHE